MMSNNDEIVTEEAFLTAKNEKQRHLRDSSSFSFEDEEDERSFNYGRNRNLIDDNVVQEEDLPVDISVTSYGQQELPYTTQENFAVSASNRFSSEIDHELNQLENEIEDETKGYLTIERENEIENVSSKGMNFEEEEENLKPSPQPQTLPPDVISTKNTKENVETSKFANLKIEDNLSTKTTQPQLQTQKSTDCEQKLFEQIRSKNTVSNLIAKFNAVATTSDEKNQKQKQDMSGASVKINELRQRFNNVTNDEKKE